MKKDAQPSRTNTRLINDAECSNTSTPILLALGILSIPHKGATRAYIRDSMTAANPPGEERVVHRFVIAGQGADFLGLNREGKAHGDLLILDKMSEGSESLSEKSLRWFMYAARSIPCARYVAKADPDTYIVWPKMRMQLGRMTSGHLSPRLYFGVHCDWTWMLPQVRPHDVRPSTTALDCLARLPVRHAQQVPQACGCCGFTVSHAWQLRTRKNAAWGSCDFANRRASSWTPPQGKAAPTCGPSFLGRTLSTQSGRSSTARPLMAPSPMLLASSMA